MVASPVPIWRAPGLEIKTLDREGSMAKSPHISRNDFVKVTVGALGAIMGVIVGLPGIGYFISPALT